MQDVRDGDILKLQVEAKEKLSGLVVINSIILTSSNPVFSYTFVCQTFVDNAVDGRYKDEETQTYITKNAVRYLLTPSMPYPLMDMIDATVPAHLKPTEIGTGSSSFEIYARVCKNANVVELTVEAMARRILRIACGDARNCRTGLVDTEQWKRKYINEWVTRGGSMRDLASRALNECDRETMKQIFESARKYNLL